MSTGYDAVLVVSFGGPEGPDEVMPFLDNVLRGRPVPRERKLAVAAHYQMFGGVSPLNEQNRSLVQALRVELEAHHLDLPVFWGNRNWHPLLGDELRRMRDAGVRRALAFVTSAYASFSGCRQYLDDIARARATIGEDAPTLDKIRLFFNHPGFVHPMAEMLGRARANAGLDAPVLFSAHSLPAEMARHCDYELQLNETARLVAERSGSPLPGWQLVFQSRTGAPDQPWLGPDVSEALARLAPCGPGPVIVAPIGFVSDHMEVVYDLDVQAAEVARQLGITMVRAPTAGTHPRFVSMIRELIQERLDPSAPRLSLGSMPPPPDFCGPGCCRRP